MFELYDAYEVIDLMEQYVANNLKDPNSMLKGTCDLLERYPSFFCLHVDFPVEVSHGKIRVRLLA